MDNIIIIWNHDGNITMCIDNYNAKQQKYSLQDDVKQEFSSLIEF